MAVESVSLDELHGYLRLRGYDVPRESQVLRDLLALHHSGQWGEWVETEFAAMWVWNERAKALLAPFALIQWPLPMEKKLYPFLYANPPKGWTGHIPENWREELKMANEAQRQKALALLFGEEVQDALEMTGHTIVNEAFAVGDPAEREAYNATMQQLADAKDLLRRFYYAFRRDVYTEAQAAVCNDAEGLLEIPSSERLI